MKVLYIHAVGPWGGSSRSLFEAVNNFPDGQIEPYFILVKGSAVEHFQKISCRIVTVKGLSRFDNTQYSYYRGIRWLVLLRELYHFPFTLYAILKARREFQYVDIIHVNDIVDIIPLILAKLVFKSKTVIHVRCLSRLNQKAIRSRLVFWVLKKFTNAIICIDESTRSSLPSDLNINIIHNSYTPKFPIETDNNFDKKIQKIDSSKFKIGFVGSLMKAKGIFELLNASKIVRDSGYDALFLYVGGEGVKSKGILEWFLKKIGLRQFLKKELEDKIKEYSLENSVLLLGHTNNVQLAYQIMDVVCVPGHADAPGRQVFEAAFSEVPTILSITQPKPDTLIPFITGIPVPLKDEEKLAEAIIYCIKNPEKTKQMGKAAKKLAIKNFTPEVNSRKILEVYQRILNQEK